MGTGTEPTLIPKAAADGVPPKGPDGARAGEWLIAFALLTGGTLATYMRVPSAGRDTLYAEDGAVFLGDWVNRPSWALIGKPYQGYQHLVPRLVSGAVAAALPVSRWATAMTFAACVLVGCVAALVFILSRDVMGLLVARIGLALIPVLLPLAALELVGNMTNIHWYLLYLVPWLLLAVPRTTHGSYLLAALAIAVAMTELQTAIFAPLALLVLLRRPPARLTAFGWAVGMAAQSASYLLTDRPRGAGMPSFESAARGYAINVALSNGNRDNEAAGRLILKHGWWPAALILITLAALAVLAAWVGGTAVRVAAATLVLGSPASWFGTYYVNNAPLYNYSAYTGALVAQVPYVRWGSTAAMLALAAVPLAAGAAVIRWPRLKGAATVAVAALLAVLLVGFSSPDNPRQLPGPGLDWTAAVRNARDTCEAGTSVDIPTQPPGWVLRVPCDRLR